MSTKYQIATTQKEKLSIAKILNLTININTFKFVLK